MRKSHTNCITLSYSFLYTEGGQNRFTVVSTQNSLFLYFYLLIIYFSIWTTVNLLLPHPIYLHIMASSFINTKTWINWYAFLTYNFSIIVKYERIKFLVIALKNAVEIYAWAPKPYHKFMAFKVSKHVIT